MALRIEIDVQDGRDGFDIAQPVEASSRARMFCRRKRRDERGIGALLGSPASIKGFSEPSVRLSEIHAANPIACVGNERRVSVKRDGGRVEMGTENRCLTQVDPEVGQKACRTVLYGRL